MTEDQIERHVERATDRLDRDFMAGTITKTAYDDGIRTLTRWAEQQYLVTPRSK